jgi:hypothetical protein
LQDAADALEKKENASLISKLVVFEEARERKANPKKRKRSLHNSNVQRLIRKEDEVVLQKGSSLFDIENVEVNQTPTMRDFNVVQHRWSVTFSKSTPKKFSELTEEFNQLLPAIHAKMLQLVTGSNKIFANIYHSKFESPITNYALTREKFQDINLEDNFFAVVQSKRDIIISEEDPLKIHIFISFLPEGTNMIIYFYVYEKHITSLIFVLKGSAGIRNNAAKRNYENMEDQIENDRTTFGRVNNSDNYCAIYSALIAIGEFESRKYIKTKNITKKNAELGQSNSEDFQEKSKYVAFCKYKAQHLNYEELKHQKSLFAIEVRKIIKDLKIADKPQTPDIFSHIAKYFDNKYNFSVVS